MNDKKNTNKSKTTTQPKNKHKDNLLHDNNMVTLFPYQISFELVVLVTSVIFFPISKKNHNM